MARIPRTMRVDFTSHHSPCGPPFGSSLMPSRSPLKQTNYKAGDCTGHPEGWHPKQRMPKVSWSSSPRLRLVDRFAHAAILAAARSALNREREFNRGVGLLAGEERNRAAPVRL